MPALRLLPITLGLVASLSLGACTTARPPDGEPRELVVLVHGMGRTPLSMAPLEISLRRAGYRVLNVGYSSQGPSVAEIGMAVSEDVSETLAHEPAPRVHFVGHSLGTVVIRWLLTHSPPDVPGRSVFLAPPNRGSHAADRLAGLLGWTLHPSASYGRREARPSTSGRRPAPRSL